MVSQMLNANKVPSLCIKKVISQTNSRTLEALDTFHSVNLKVNFLKILILMAGVAPKLML